MLEYNFNDLDNDFITLWSDYILNNDKSKIHNNLVKLAENGQINAIQCYYVQKKDEETNELIDKLVDNFQSFNINELLAQSFRAYSVDKKYIEKLENKYKKLNKKLLQTISYNSIEENGQLYDAMGLIELDLKETLYHSYLKVAIECGIKNYLLTNNVLVAERVLEVEPVSFVKSKIKYKKVRKELIKLLEHAVEINSKDIDNYKFALAKNLVLFKSSK